MTPIWIVRTMRGEVEYTSHDGALAAAANLAVAWEGMPIHIVYPSGVIVRLVATEVRPESGDAS